MKIAMIADIHGQRKHIKAVLSAIKAHHVDHIYCLGDIFECKISKKHVDSFTFAFVDQVVDQDPKLYKRMRNISCIIGNQEERIRSLVPVHSIPDPELQYFLSLPPAIELDNARLEHGHTFVDEADWAPYPKYMTKRLLFFGHTHESALYQMRWSKMKWIPEKQDFTYGEPLALDKQLHWAINVGAVVNADPEWLLYDEEEQKVTFFREPAPLD